MKRVLITGALAIAAATQAFAADLPPPMAPAPRAPAAYVPVSPAYKLERVLYRCERRLWLRPEQLAVGPNRQIRRQWRSGRRNGWWQLSNRPARAWRGRGL